MESVIKSIILFLTIIMSYKIDLDLEHYLNKKVTTFDVVAIDGFRASSSYKLNKKGSYYNAQIRNIFFETDTLNTIITVRAFFSGVLNEKFYQDMIENYGSPDRILKEDKILNEEKHKGEDGYVSNAKEYSTKKVNYDDEPTLILWEGDKFDISIIFNYLKNKTKISFKTK